MRVDAVFCCCRLVVVYIKVNMKKISITKNEHSIKPLRGENERMKKKKKILKNTPAQFS
jgi:hypothetical protein